MDVPLSPKTMLGNHSFNHITKIGFLNLVELAEWLHFMTTTLKAGLESDLQGGSPVNFVFHRFDFLQYLFIMIAFFSEQAI